MTYLFSKVISLLEFWLALFGIILFCTSSKNPYTFIALFRFSLHKVAPVYGLVVRPTKLYKIYSNISNILTVSSSISKFFNLNIFDILFSKLLTFTIGEGLFYAHT